MMPLARQDRLGRRAGEMKFRCTVKSCRERFTLGEGVRECPACGEPIGSAMAAPSEKQIRQGQTPKVVVARSNKRRKRVRPKSKPAPTAFRAVLKHNGMSWRLPYDGRQLKVRVEGRPAAQFLEDSSLLWEIVGRDVDEVLLIKPVECRAVRDALARSEASDRIALTRPRPDTDLKPPPRGESHLEVFMRDHNMIECAREIQRLARAEDVPRAWRALANGWRVDRLRDPIRAAMLDIGWQRIRAFVLHGPYKDDWEADLIAWLRELDGNEEERKRSHRSVRVLRDEDYGLVDW